MEDLMLYAGDAVKELEKADKLSEKSEGILSFSAECGTGVTLLCC